MKTPAEFPQQGFVFCPDSKMEKNAVFGKN